MTQSVVVPPRHGARGRRKPIALGSAAEVKALSDRLGGGVAGLAKHYGCSVSTMYKVLDVAGIDLRIRRGRPFRDVPLGLARRRFLILGAWRTVGYCYDPPVAVNTFRRNFEAADERFPAGTDSDVSASAALNREIFYDYLRYGSVEKSAAQKKRDVALVREVIESLEL